MKTTAAILKSLQDHYASLAIRPSVKDVAKSTNMPIATAGRYLNGTTQQGDPERVRALCIALDRSDLLDDLPHGAPVINSFQEAWALVIETKREARESNLEELERVRKSHEESEKRLLAELERTTAGSEKTIDMLTNRISLLEDDKKTLAVEKASALSDLSITRRRKRQYEAVMIFLFVVLALYFIIFDLPHPDYGITEVLIDLFK